jgi:hypothetical protein
LDNIGFKREEARVRESERAIVRERTGARPSAGTGLGFRV